MATASFGTVFKVGRKHESSFNKVLSQKVNTIDYGQSKFVKASECEALKKVFQKQEQLGNSLINKKECLKHSFYFDIKGGM